MKITSVADDKSSYNIYVNNKRYQLPIGGTINNINISERVNEINVNNLQARTRYITIDNNSIECIYLKTILQTPFILYSFDNLTWV